MPFRKDLLIRTRKTLKISRKRLSELSGVHEETIWKLESGRSASPRVRTIEAIARVLDIELAIFFGDDSSLRKDDAPNV